MRLTIAYFRIKKRNLLLINNDTHQRETVSGRPIRPPLNFHYLPDAGYTPIAKITCWNYQSDATDILAIKHFDEVKV